MAIKFLCEGCYKIIVVQDSISGKVMTCPYCAANVIVPDKNTPIDEVAQLPKGVLEDRSEAVCPFCSETIKSASKKCPFCKETLDKVLKVREDMSRSGAENYIEDNDEYQNKAERLGMRAFIIAMVGWFTCAFLVEPIALLTAQKALKIARKTDNPVKTGYAYAAIVIGIIGFTLQTISILIFLNSRH